jgi:hypothetical protein
MSFSPLSGVFQEEGSFVTVRGQSIVLGQPKSNSKVIFSKEKTRTTIASLRVL